MSDQKPINSLDLLAISERQKINSLIFDAFFGDYGFALSDSDGTTVDVQLMALDVMAGGIEAQSYALDPIVIRKLELFFPSSSGMAQSWTVKKGDGILLIGLRNWIPSVAGITESSMPAEFFHYAPNTMKAIPLSPARSDATVQFGEKNGKSFLRNKSQSLFTVLNDIASHTKQIAINLQSATTIPAVVGSPLTFNTATIANFTTDAANLATDAANLAALLEE